MGLTGSDPGQAQWARKPGVNHRQDMQGRRITSSGKNKKFNLAGTKSSWQGAVEHADGEADGNPSCLAFPVLSSDELSRKVGMERRKEKEGIISF